MPKNLAIPETSTACQRLIMLAVPGINKRYAQRLAYRIVRKQARHRVTLDFYYELRILGILTDTTARDAISNLKKGGSI